MQHEPLITAIKKYINLDTQQEDYVLSLFRSKHVKRKQILLDEGDINTRAIFVLNGCLRSYATDKNGVEHVLQFAPAGWWIADMHSFMYQKPARMSIDAIEDSDILTIMHADFEKLHATVPAFEHYTRMLTMNALATYQYRQLDALSLSAMERYKNFCTVYPSLIQSLPQKQVASYIGVTPEFLSRMLNNNMIR